MSRNETAVIEDVLDPPFEIIEPVEHTAPFVFNSPHSGRIYFREFLAASRLNLTSLRKSEDTFVEQLFAPVASLGAPLLHAHFPRAYLDVNREPYELDPALIAESLPRYANTQSVRVVGGLGTIARIVTESEEIYRRPMTLGDALERINNLYKPYHAALGGLMDASMEKFGMAVLIDCHSMPSNPLYDTGDERPDFVLGDRFSTSCNPDFTRLVAERLKAMGYMVAFNKPYAGGFITEHYGRPCKDRHALQIEVNRALYLNEASYQRSKDFDRLRQDIMRLVEAMIELIPALRDVPRAAAE
ncbi:MAG: N-formylglutamate amidohydrolase [Methyloligellaceae bacterium]